MAPHLDVTSARAPRAARAGHRRRPASSSRRRAALLPRVSSVRAAASTPRVELQPGVEIELADARRSPRRRRLHPRGSGRRARRVLRPRRHRRRLPAGEAQPVRLEFVGDMVESLRRFDPATQRSIETHRPRAARAAARVLPEAAAAARRAPTTPASRPSIAPARSSTTRAEAGARLFVVEHGDVDRAGEALRRVAGRAATPRPTRRGRRVLAAARRSPCRGASSPSALGAGDPARSRWPSTTRRSARSRTSPARASTRLSRPRRPTGSPSCARRASRRDRAVRRRDGRAAPSAPSRCCASTTSLALPVERAEVTRARGGARRRRRSVARASACRTPSCRSRRDRRLRRRAPARAPQAPAAAGDAARSSPTSAI